MLQEVFSDHVQRWIRCGPDRAQRLARTKTRQRRTFQRALRRELGTSQQVGPQYQSELQLPDRADYWPGGAIV